MAFIVPLEEIFDEARDRFMESCQTHKNPIVKSIAAILIAADTLLC